MPFYIRTRWYLLLFCGLIIANIVLYKGIAAPAAISITVFPNTGAPVALVRLPSGGTILVNAGPDASTLRELGMTLPEWQRSLDTLVLTSGNAKAVGGAPLLLVRYHVHRIIRFGAPAARTTETALAAVEQRSMVRTALPYGTRLMFAPRIYIAVPSSTLLTLGSDTDSLKISSTTPIGTYRLSVY